MQDRELDARNYEQLAVTESGKGPLKGSLRRAPSSGSLQRLGLRVIAVALALLAAGYVFRRSRNWMQLRN